MSTPKRVRRELDHCHAFIGDLRAENEKLQKLLSTYESKRSDVGQIPLVRLELTPEQAEALSDALNNHQDRGPQGEGWASKGLQELRDLVDDAIEQSQHNAQPQS